MYPNINCHSYSSCEKRWSHDEIRKMLDFVKRNRKLEVPSAKLFYEAMMQETGIEGSWQNMRCQMRFLKMTLSKANNWLSTNDFNLKDKKSAIEYARDRFCPFYYELAELFGQEFSTLELCSDANQENTSSSSDENEEPSVSAKAKKGKNRNGASKPKIRRKEASLEAAKLQIEGEKFQWAKEKEYRELKIKEKKVENELYLKKLELEHKKEIAMYKIQMKRKDNPDKSPED
ncbi:uncharacterized protein LOC108028772 isoform X1 [Drosophila biarmipes]|uniref:uncharacterized protein LOC108028772 isoform X1 n=2 Tax=Drosophila biarmipes TaxID=125945 RepID=UPI0007E5CC52|nr:uncharacterized protein LOC108028772 isoform X1 [Drosophila biarmipes]